MIESTYFVVQFLYSISCISHQRNFFVLISNTSIVNYIWNQFSEILNWNIYFIELFLIQIQMISIYAEENNFWNLMWSFAIEPFNNFFCSVDISSNYNNWKIQIDKSVCKYHSVIFLESVRYVKIININQFLGTKTYSQTKRKWWVDSNDFLFYIYYFWSDRTSESVTYRDCEGIIE